MSDINDKNRRLDSADITPKGKVRSMSPAVHSNQNEQAPSTPHYKARLEDESAFPEIFLALVKAVGIALLGMLAIYYGWVLFGLLTIIGAIFYFMFDAAISAAFVEGTSTSQHIKSNLLYKRQHNTDTKRAAYASNQSATAPAPKRALADAHAACSKPSDSLHASVVTAAGVGLYGNTNFSGGSTDYDALNNSNLDNPQNIVISNDELGLSGLPSDTTTINPATGLLMSGGVGGVDTAGNPYGFDLMTSESIATGAVDTGLFDDQMHSTSFDDTTSLDSGDSFDSFDSTSFDDNW